MNAAFALARAEAAGVVLDLAANGAVRLTSSAPPPAEVLTELRRWRAKVAALVIERAEVEARTAFYLHAVREAAEALAVADADLAAERATRAEHYAAPSGPNTYQPGAPDPLRDGLLRGFHAHHQDHRQ